jgi:hypothetical protein
MAKLSGQDIAELSHLLADTLSSYDLDNYVHASTGDRLYIEVAEFEPFLCKQVRGDAQLVKITSKPQTAPSDARLSNAFSDNQVDM